MYYQYIGGSPYAPPLLKCIFLGGGSPLNFSAGYPTTTEGLNLSSRGWALRFAARVVWKL